MCKCGGHDDHTQISVDHYHGDPCLSRARHPRLGRVCRLLLPPGADRAFNLAFRVSGVALFSSGNLSPGVREDRANRWVILAFGLIGVLAGYLPAYTDRVGFWTFDGDTIRWFGVVLFAVGGALRIWPVFVLGPRFSGLVAIQPGHTLVTSGAYGTIRHPSYLGLLVNSLGWALAFRSGVGVLLTTLLIPPLLARINAEETLLRTQFGAEYDVYCSGTSRLIPGLY